VKITLKRDFSPAADFYYHHQFPIYYEPYLIWDRDTWEDITTTCDVYRIEVDGKYAGDVILEGKGKKTKYIVDFSILPEYQGKGVGKAVLGKVKKMSWKLSAVTRKETLHFFLKSGFVSRRTIKNYYDPGVEGYDIIFVSDASKMKRERKLGISGSSLSS
jgi:GNAT superfamily N-acetyltransferase